MSFGISTIGPNSAWVPCWFCVAASAPLCSGRAPPRNWILRERSGTSASPLGLSRREAGGRSAGTPSKSFCFSTSVARWIGTSQLAEELFSAARSEFKHFAHFYFHNCTYKSVWTKNRGAARPANSPSRRDPHLSVRLPLVFVGDVSISPYEIALPGGSVEHWNEEAGAVWLQRVLDHFPKAVWLNPSSASIGPTRNRSGWCGRSSRGVCSLSPSTVWTRRCERSSVEPSTLACRRRHGQTVQFGRNPNLAAKPRVRAHVGCEIEHVLLHVDRRSHRLCPGGIVDIDMTGRTGARPPHSASMPGTLLRSAVSITVAPTTVRAVPSASRYVIFTIESSRFGRRRRPKLSDLGAVYGKPRPMARGAGWGSAAARRRTAAACAARTASASSPIRCEAPSALPALSSVHALNMRCERPSADRSRGSFQGMSRDQALVERVGAGDGRKERPALTCEQFQKVSLQDAVGERLPAEMIEIDDGGIRRRPGPWQCRAKRETMEV